MTALLVLRDKVIKPLLAGSCQLQRAEARQHHALDQHYQRLQVGMQDLFREMGIAA
jgi:hypothetical protein